MKAVRVTEWGQAVQVQDVPQPSPNNDEVLVRVRAASINPFDLAVVAGHLQSMLTTPTTPGMDFAGEVVSVGADVKHVKPGDEVYGMAPMGGGTFAEYTIAKATSVAPKPKSVDYAHAASVPLVGMTAWQSLFDIAKLQSGERVLIHGAAGAVGSFAVQFAKQTGAYVIANAGPGSEAFLKGLGVDQYINYEEQPFEDVVRDVDVVLSTTGGDVLQRSYSVLKRGGRLVTPAGQPSLEEAERLGIHASSVRTQPNVDNLSTIAGLIDAGKIKTFVDSTFPLEQAQTALEASQKPHKIGKVVLTVVS